MAGPVARQRRPLVHLLKTENEMRIHLLLSLCLPVFAQTTTITGTITDPAGDLLSGSCSIQAVGPFTAASGWSVIGAPTVVRFSGGALTVPLVPTDSASPSTQYYKVTCAVPQQTVNGRLVGPYSWGPRYWVVPTSLTSFNVGTVEMTSPPVSPLWTINWSQLAQNGAQIGQGPIWNGTSWQPGAVNIPLTVPPQDGQYMRWNAAQSAWQPVTFADQETVSGTIDGTNTAFTLANPPAPPAGLVLFRNGMAQKAGQDYTLAGNTISFVAAATPQAGDMLLAWYRY
jgi:hypothetical protein